jgi:hypothetical protein
MNKPKLLLRIAGLGEARAEGALAVLILSALVLLLLVGHVALQLGK